MIPLKFNYGLFLVVIFMLLMPMKMKAYGSDSSVVNISATILSKNLCKFSTNKAALDFGTLDPTNPAVRNASTTISFVCNGADASAVYTITEDGGQDNYKMTHTTDPTQKLPYSIVLTPTSGVAPKGIDQVLTIDGSIQGLDYQTALVGSYSDTVIITIDP